MRRSLISLLSTVLLLGATGCRPERSVEGLAPHERPNVAQVSFRDTQGQQGSLAEYAGKVVLVDVWATWCPPCRKSLPEVAELQKKAGSDYAVLAISVDREGFGAVQPFLAANPGLGLSAVVPAEARSLEPFGEIRGIPTTLIIDRQGRLRERWSGYVPGRAEKALQEALREP